MTTRIALLLAAFLSIQCSHSPVAEQQDTDLRAPSSNQCNNARSCPWLNQSLAPEQRVKLLVGAMTTDQKLQLVFGYFSSDSAENHYTTPVDGRQASAGYIPGIPALGIPSQYQTDAGVGVATQVTPTPRERTALPSGIATAATWNRNLAYSGGEMIGNEARLSGFNVQLAGGVNLLREPRNGRNFEYAGEDPLLAGLIVGEEIRGIQSNHIISTVKHYAFNDQEDHRGTLNAVIDNRSARMSDLLAFQIAIETGHPGSVMCSYNRINGQFACENSWLLTDVLKGDWNYQGYVMSDWGATHSAAKAANAGLDQDSGFPFDDAPYFQKPLGDAVAANAVSQERLNDMVSRILRQMFVTGLFDDPVAGDRAEQIDFKAHAKITQADAEEGIVLLKNANAILPLDLKSPTIAIIGGHADVGVISGGGSSQVYPVGGSAVPNEGPKYFPGPMVFYPSSPLVNLEKITAVRGKASNFVYADGKNLAQAQSLAAKCDIVVVFATQWTGESMDAKSLTLPNHQDELIEAIAQKNHKVVVVLETDGPVLMPWLNHVSGVVEAWYPGTAGGLAIARILAGEVNPSGHLPVTFPRSESQLPISHMQTTTVHYEREGAAVGYKWFDLHKLNELFAFGHGLSYTSFQFSDLAFSQGGRYQVRFKSTNTGRIAGKTVAQIYAAPLNTRWEAPQRLVMWDKVTLNPQQTTESTLSIDPRLLAVYDPASKKWKIAEGDYELRLATSAKDIVARQIVHLQASEF